MFLDCSSDLSILIRQNMHLTKVKVANFRNLKDITVDFGSGLNVLVGPNNAGKTNLFDAIKYALGPDAIRAEPVWLSKEDLFCEPQSVQPADAQAISKIEESTISIQLVFTELGSDEASQFFEILDFQTNADLTKAPAKINFEATWLPLKDRFQVARWGGSENGERSAIPTEILQALPLISLPALRNAEEALTPGNKSVLARVLEDLSRRVEGAHQKDFEGIFTQANDALADQPLVKRLQERLRLGTQEMAGSSYSQASVQAAEPEFRRILKTLRVILDAAPVMDISRSGMGYNNLLFIATILAQLEKAVPGDKKTDFECPIVLIEEPEAHLNPQNIVLLGNYLSSLGIPQVLASSHSPTFASHVKPSQVQLLFSRNNQAACNAIRSAKLGPKEERQLQRMLDVTKATLYFARGVILVEGLSEALLIPEFALDMGINLTKKHISIVPICGVDFGVFGKLFTSTCLDIPLSIITDSDPEVVGAKLGWENHQPKLGTKCGRLVKLEKIFSGRENVGLYSSAVTLEYDLAQADKDNPTRMAEIWESSFIGSPQTFNKKLLKDLSHADQILATWRGICRAENSGSKADFAQLLATWISERRNAGNTDPALPGFKIPKYIQDAIKFVSDKLP